MTDPRGLRGSIVWAICPFQPEPPFTVWLGAGETVVFEDAVALARAVAERRIPPVPNLIAPAKLRPVLVLQDIPQGRIPEFAALKLIRLSKLSASDRDVIRAMQDPSFVPLCRAPTVYGLREQNAVDLNSIIRVHESALVTGPVGRLDARELADVDRLVPSLLQIDLTSEVRRQVMQRWEALAHQQASEQS